jgi:type I restriction enzyme R subunit
MVPSPTDPEQLARRDIDKMLTAAGWAIQNRKDLNLGAGPGVAVREFQTGAGPADYALFLGNQLVGVIEAKRVGKTLSEVEAQSRAYAEQAPEKLQVPIRPLPFLYESTGVETWFTNGLDPDPTARPVFSFHRPDTLKQWLSAELDRKLNKPGAPRAPTVKGRMRLAPGLNSSGMWPAQIRAVENLEASVRDGRPRALIQMATGSGKTFTAISAVYRLIREGGAKRILFLVDRGNLGRQALKEFQAFTTPDDGRKFTELYNVVNLTHNAVDPVNKVVITTIQRLYSILKGEPDYDESLEEGSAFTGSGGSLLREPPPVVYNEAIPLEFFDVVVVDECHRSIYTLWRQVLEYFDASLVGLTATPAGHTYAFFNRNVVSEYPHQHAVRDRVNVPFQVFEIRTKVTEGGGRIIAEEGAIVGRRERATRKTRWEAVDQDEEYTATQVDRSVVVPDQIRTIIREIKARMFTEIFPGRFEFPKTLIFAKSDDHAEDILRIVREEWGLSNEGAVKITYKPERTDGDTSPTAASKKPEDQISAFRNSYFPRVAVTVDMIATGTDIKPLECVIFLRTVKSRALFEQMKGRGVRVIPDADFRAVTPDATTKTHFVVIDCVGVMEEQKSDPPMDREKGVPFSKLVELVRAGNRDEDILSTLAARLDRMDRRLTPDQRVDFERQSEGVTLRSLVEGLINGLDPDRSDERARTLFTIPPDRAPSGEQLEAAQLELREEAANPIAHAPKLCQALLEVRRAQDVTIDVTTLDEVTHAGARPELAPNYDADLALISEFQAYCTENRDKLDALQVLYSRPRNKRLERDALRELAAAIQRPPRQWTNQLLWEAYERVEKSRVRGASKGKLLTDLISLARHAMGVEGELVSFADVATARFQNWLGQQANRGRTFSPEQQEWLGLIRDRIVADLEVRLDDFDDTPFADRGGLGKAAKLFGPDLEGIVEELNRELVA